MNRTQFWQIIEGAKTKANSAEQQVKYIEDTLAGMTPEEIYSFESHLLQAMRELLRGDIWNVVYIIEGGCGEDAFFAFRNWLILQGVNAFEAVLRDPVILAEYTQKHKDFYNENLAGVAEVAFLRRTGMQFDYPHESEPPDPVLTGGPLPREALKRLYPNLWAKFMERGDSS